MCPTPSALFTATQQLDESLDVLLGMVGHPYFTEQTIAKEQGIIGQEIKMYDDSPDWDCIRSRHRQVGRRCHRICGWLGQGVQAGQRLNL